MDNRPLQKVKKEHKKPRNKIIDSDPMLTERLAKENRLMDAFRHPIWLSKGIWGAIKPIENGVSRFDLLVKPIEIDVSRFDLRV